MQDIKKNSKFKNIVFKKNLKNYNDQVEKLV